MKTSTLLASPILAALTATCAHGRDASPQQMETTSAPMPANTSTSPTSTAPLNQGTTATDQSPGSSAWGTSGNTGTIEPSYGSAPRTSTGDAGAQPEPRTAPAPR